MEKVAAEFDPTRLIRYIDDIPMLATALSRNKPAPLPQDPEKKKKVDKPVQPSISEKQAAAKGPLDNLNDMIAHSREKRKKIKELMQRAIQESEENAKALQPLMDKPLETLSDSEKALVNKHTNLEHVNLKRKPKKLSDWGFSTPKEAPVTKITGPEFKRLRSAGKLPGWLKALGVLGGAGLAGYVGYRIYKENKKKKPMEKNGGLVLDYLIKKLTKRQEKLKQRKEKKQGIFIKTKLREM